MSIRRMPSVEGQPLVTLIRWRVMRLKAKKVSADVILGWCLEDGYARMSTAIKQHDAKARTLTTKSGRVYVVQGPHGYDDDAQYILEEYFWRVAGKAVDVSSEYFDDLPPAEQDELNVEEHIVPPDVDVLLSQGDSRSFIHEIDLPFQPNTKLAKALKRAKWLLLIST